MRERGWATQKRIENGMWNTSKYLVPALQCLILASSVLVVACSQSSTASPGHLSPSIAGDWYSSVEHESYGSDGNAYTEGIDRPRIGWTWHKADDGSFQIRNNEGSVHVAHIEEGVLYVAGANNRDALSRLFRAGTPLGLLQEAKFLSNLGRHQESITILRTAAKSGRNDAQNELAWALATGPEEVRRCAEAETIAQKVVEHDRDSKFLDTLAAAYACQGKWTDAVATQRNAIAGLVGSKDTSSLAAYKDRLDNYEAHRSSQ